MKNQSKSSGITLKKFVFWAATIALLVTLVVFILEKSRVTNIYTKPTPTVAPDTTTRPINSIDYSPASEAEKPTPDQKKQDASTGASTPAQSSSKPISVTLSAATQDTPGGPIVVRTILGGTTGGTCTITVTKDSFVKTYSSDITWTGTYYSCNKDIPFADISTGTWQLKVVANQNNNQGSATETVVVKSS